MIANLCLVSTSFRCKNIYLFLIAYHVKYVPCKVCYFTSYFTWNICSKIHKSNIIASVCYLASHEYHNKMKFIIIRLNDNIMTTTKNKYILAYIFFSCEQNNVIQTSHQLYSYRTVFKCRISSQSKKIL